MKNATFPACPINDCEGKFIHSHAIANNEYYKCNRCGSLSCARKFNESEALQVKVDRARKRAKEALKRKRKKMRNAGMTKKQIDDALRQENRKVVLEVKQLPVEGWSINEWFPEEEQCRLQTQLHLNI